MAPHINTQHTDTQTHLKMLDIINSVKSWDKKQHTKLSYLYTLPMINLN
jgi:hypothetical protein